MSPNRERKGWFPTSRWTLILAARTKDPERQRELVGMILAQYIKPVNAFLRRQGESPEQADEFAQGFFTHVVLGRGLIQRADPMKGRFRNLLLKALTRYVKDVRKKDGRHPGTPLDAVEHLDLPQLRDTATPAQAFVCAWVSQLLDDAIAAVEAGCRRAGQEKHWDVFRRTALEPIMTGAKAPSLSQLCAELNIGGEVRAANMKITVKRRLRAAVKMRVRDYVSSDEEVEQEIHDLFAILSGWKAR